MKIKTKWCVTKGDICPLLKFTHLDKVPIWLHLKIYYIYDFVRSSQAQKEKVVLILDT